VDGIGTTGTPGRLGAALSVKDTTALALLDVSNLTPGTLCYILDGDVFYDLVPGGTDVDAAGVDGIGWDLFQSAEGCPQPNPGANLTDDDVSVDPGDLAISVSILPAATLEANRVLTIIDTGDAPDALLYQVIRYDLTANTYTVKDEDGTTLFVFGASPPVPQAATFQWDPDTELYVFLNTFWVMEL